MSNYDDFDQPIIDDEKQVSPFGQLSASKQRLIKMALPVLCILLVATGLIYQQLTEIDYVAMSATETVQSIERLDRAVIEINGPFSGQMFNIGTTIFFSWDWIRPLNDGEQFVVRLDRDEIGRIDQAQNNTFYRIEQATDTWDAGSYNWSVTLENAEGRMADDVAEVTATFLMTNTVIESVPTIPQPATPTPRLPQ